MQRYLTSTLFALAAFLAAAAAAPAAQAQYHYGAAPIVHYGHYGYHYPKFHHGHHYGYHASTPAEGYLRGWGHLYRSRGLYNLYTSQAAINFEEARSRNLDNRLKKAETFFAMRELNESYRAAHRRPAATAEMISQWNESRAPQRLSTDQLDPASGEIDWPAALRGKTFDASRATLEELFDQRASDSSGLGSRNADKIRQAAGQMLSELKTRIELVSGTEFMQGKNFIDSLAYEARFETMAEGLASK